MNPNGLPGHAERIQIRTASKSDAEAITEIQSAAICEAYRDVWSVDKLASILGNARTRAAVGANIWGPGALWSRR